MTDQDRCSLALHLGFIVGTAMRFKSLSDVNGFQDADREIMLHLHSEMKRSVEAIGKALAEPA